MNVSIEKDLVGITPASIEKYMLLTGWRRDVSFNNTKIMVFQNLKDTKVRIAVPATNNLKDYSDRIFDFIRFLNSFTGCSMSAIISSLKSAYIDKLQFRIISDSSREGKIPLEYAAQCIEGLKDLVLYSACAEERATPVCVRAFNSAKGRLDNFQFEQTEFGSFIFNVSVRVAEEDNEQLYIEGVDPTVDIPPEHRVVERIETAISQVVSVADEKISVKELVEYGYEDGITANMCDAFMLLQPEREEIQLETSIHYAEAITRKVTPPRMTIFRKKHFLFIEEISECYRSRTVVEDAVLVGFVKMLSKNQSGQEIVEDNTDNTVRLITHIDQKVRTVDLHLTLEDYTMACNAHRDDKEIMVSGTIDKSGKQWFFSEIREFKVIE